MSVMWTFRPVHTSQPMSISACPITLLPAPTSDRSPMRTTTSGRPRMPMPQPAVTVASEAITTSRPRWMARSLTMTLGNPTIVPGPNDPNRRARRERWPIVPLALICRQVQSTAASVAASHQRRTGPGGGESWGSRRITGPP